MSGRRKHVPVLPTGQAGNIRVKNRHFTVHLENPERKDRVRFEAGRHPVKQEGEAGGPGGKSTLNGYYRVLPGHIVMRKNLLQRRNQKLPYQQAENRIKRNKKPGSGLVADDNFFIRFPVPYEGIVMATVSLPVDRKHL